MVLKSNKGIYMQLETGKIIAIRTALKVGHNKDKTQQETPFMAREMQKRSPSIGGTNKVVPVSVAATATATAPTTTATATLATGTGNVANSATTFTPTNTKTTARGPRSANHVQFGRNNTMGGSKPVQMGTAKPYMKSNARGSMSAATTPMSNDSSFDADISDDSQFLEKLGENLAKSTDDDNDDGQTPMQMNTENKCVEPMMHGNMESQQNQPHQLHHQNQPHQMNNGDSMATLINDKSNSMSHTQIANKSDQLNRQSYGNANMGNVPADTYNNNNNNNNAMNHSSNGQKQPQNSYPAGATSMQNYNYNQYNAPQNIGYNDVQSTPNATGQSSQEMMHQSNLMNQTRQSDKYSGAAQHVS